MPSARYLRTMIKGMPVVVALAEVDTTSAEELRAVLFDAASPAHPTVVLDMTRTRFCDSAGMNAILRANRRAQMEGGELRLAVPADGAVPRVFAMACLDRVVPCFTNVKDALAGTRAAADLAPVITLSDYRRRRQH